MQPASQRAISLIAPTIEELCHLTILSELFFTTAEVLSDAQGSTATAWPETEMGILFQTGINP
jgi:hypothetical protein